jgi:hypothetical protein
MTSAGFVSGIWKLMVGFDLGLDCYIRIPGITSYPTVPRHRKRPSWYPNFFRFHLHGDSFQRHLVFRLLPGAII